MFKKVLSIFLACVLMLGTMGTVVFAEDAAVSAWDGETADTSWYNAETNTYQITSAAQLAGLAQLVNGGNTFSGKTISLGANIDLAGKEWTPIGLTGDKAGFQGTFNGDGKTISNLTVTLTDGEYLSAGLFGSARYATISNFTMDTVNLTNYETAGASCNGTAAVVGSAQFPSTIEDVTVKNVVINSNRYSGGIAGYFAGTINNCSVENLEITAIPNSTGTGYDNGDKVGGVVGYLNSGDNKITNNTVSDATIKAYRDIGGIAGCGQKDADISGNTVSGEIKITSDQKTNFYEKKDANTGVFVGRENGSVINACKVLGTAEVTITIIDSEGKTTTETFKHVCAIGEDKYYSLADAVDAAKDGNIIKLLDNINLGDTTIVNTKTVTLDLNGKTISGAKATKATSGHELLLNKGDLTIIDSEKNGKITYEYTGESTQFATATNVITNNPGAVLNVKSGTFENKTNVASHATYVIDARTNGGGGDSKVVIDGGKIVSTKVAAIRGFANSTTNIVDITINDGDITGYAYIQDPNNNANKGKLTVNDGTFKAVGDNYAIYQYGLGDASNISTTINGGTFDGTVYITGNSITNNFAASITDGKFNGSVWVCAWNNSVSTDLKAISGGYFTENPSAYLAEGKVIETSDIAGYGYKVVEKNEDITVETTVTAGETKVDTGDVVIPDGATFEANANDIEAAAATLTNDAKVVDEDAAKEALGVEDTDTDTTVTVIVEPYLDIKITEYDEEDKTMTLKIEALYNVVATTATGDEEVKTEGDDKNAVVIGDPKKLEVTTPMTITVGLPNGFADNGETVYIHHTKDNGTTYVYEATVKVADGKTTATFTNPNGFSKFEVKKNDSGKAKIGDTVYATLADAVANVEDGEKIVLLADVDAEEVVTVTELIKFSVDAGECDFDEDNIKAGDKRKVTYTKEGDVYTFTVKKKTTPPAGSNNSGTSGNNNGFRDDNSYVPSTPQQSVPDKTFKFADVADDFWGYDGIYYCYENGIMNGMGGSVFEPNTTMTRAMLVTMLYRLEGSPEVETAETEWYSKAQAWAMENAVSDGTNMTDEITREQLATMLCRYASKQGVDTGISADLTEFTDNADISEYAYDAVSWAVRSGFINGMGDGTLSPKGGATRAQVATIFMRAADVLK